MSRQGNAGDGTGGSFEVLGGGFIWRRDRDDGRAQTDRLLLFVISAITLRMRLTMAARGHACVGPVTSQPSPMRARGGDADRPVAGNGKFVQARRSDLLGRQGGRKPGSVGRPHVPEHVSGRTTKTIYPRAADGTPGVSSESAPSCLRNPQLRTGSAPSPRIAVWCVIPRPSIHNEALDRRPDVPPAVMRVSRRTGKVD